MDRPWGRRFQLESKSESSQRQETNSPHLFAQAQRRIDESLGSPFSLLDSSDTSCEAQARLNPLAEPNDTENYLTLIVGRELNVGSEGLRLTPSILPKQDSVICELKGTFPIHGHCAVSLLVIQRHHPHLRNENDQTSCPQADSCATPYCERTKGHADQADICQYYIAASDRYGVYSQTTQSHSNFGGSLGN